MRKYLLVIAFIFSIKLVAQAQPVLLNEGFETTFPPAGWVNINAGTGNSWTDGFAGAAGPHTGTFFAEYIYNTTSAANAWLISGGVALTSGVTYRISYWTNTENTIAFTENLRVTVGTSQTVAGQTTTLQTLNNYFRPTTYEYQSVTYTASANGTYYFGFNCFSAADQNILLLDDIKIECASCPYFNVTPASLPTFTSSSGVASFQQSYNVNGENLTSPVVVTAPTGFEVSLTSGGSFVGSGSVSVSPISGKIDNVSVFARSNSASAGTFTGNISNASIGLTTQNVAVSGNNTVCVGVANTITFTGPGAFDWNTPASWSLGHVPFPCEDVVINYLEASGGGDTRTVNIGIPVVIRSLTLSNIPVGNGNKQLQVINTSPFLITGDLTIRASGGNNTGTEAFFGASNSTITVLGNTTLGGGTGTLRRVSFGSFNGVNTYTFGGNLTFNTNSFTYRFGTWIFSGSSNQTITADATLFTNGMAFENVKIANSNGSTVSVAGGAVTNPLYVYNDLSILNNGSLSIPSTFRFNQFTPTVGNLSLSRNANLIVGGATGGIGASNFPLNFSRYILDSASTVNFSGAAQTIPGTTQLVNSYGNLTTSGSGVKSLGSDINVFRNLTIGSGTNFTPGTSTVALKSNSVTTANLAAVAGTITDATGQFSIERYLPSQVAWRLLAAPIRAGTSPSVFAAYQEGTTATTSTGFGTQITGVGAGNGFDLQTPSYSMKYFNPGTQNYTPITNTSTAIANPAGHYIFVRGDKSIAPGGGGFTTLRMKGQVFTGTQVVNVPAGGFASFGNPYPSRIDMRTTTKSASLVDGFTVWNPGSPGSFNVGGYEAYTLQSGQYRNSAGTVIRNFIESGEAVFIQTAPASPAGTLTINESDKGNGSSVVSREGTIGGNDARFVLALSRLDAANVPTYKSAVLINPDAAYSNGLDNNDVRKFNNSSDNLSMSIAAANLEVNRRNVFTAADTIFLKLTSTAVANYMFDAFAENIDAPGLTAYLQDKFTNTTTLISLNDSTHIPFSISAVAGSNASDRFSIVFKEVQVLPISYTSITVVRNADKTATVNWAVATETGVQNYGIEHSTDGITFMKIGEQAASNIGLDAIYSFIHTTASSGENFYRIRSKEVAGDSKLSNIAKLSATQELNNSLLSVFPNPVSNGVMNVTLAATAGKYQITLYDNAGKQVLQKSGLVAARNSIDVAGLSAGIYTLVATDGKEKYSLKVSIQ